MSARAMIPVEFSVFTATDSDELVALLGDVFSRHDPPAYAVGLSAPEFEAFVRLLCAKAAAEQLTLLARRADSGELIGALVTEDCASAMPFGMDQLSTKFEPILDILGQLSAEYWNQRVPAPGEALHLFLLGVADAAAGCGIAQQLVAAGLEHGATRGYRLAVTEATNPVSQHIFRKHGFVERARRAYDAHRFNGRAVFSGIAEHGGPVLMDLHLAG